MAGTIDRDGLLHVLREYPWLVTLLTEEADWWPLEDGGYHFRVRVVVDLDRSVRGRRQLTELSLGIRIADPQQQSGKMLTDMAWDRPAVLRVSPRPGRCVAGLHTSLSLHSAARPGTL